MAVGEFLGNGNPDGTSLGLSATELISFYGATPLAQQTLAANGTDAATTQALANDIKVKLKALGLCA
jgi:hypothetical protein